MIHVLPNQSVVSAYPHNSTVSPDRESCPKKAPIFSISCGDPTCIFDVALKVLDNFDSLSIPWGRAPNTPRIGSMRCVAIVACFAPSRFGGSLHDTSLLLL